MNTFAVVMVLGGGAVWRGSEGVNCLTGLETESLPSGGQM